jgi:hypothetical protein
MILSLSNSFGQTRLFLEHKTKPGKIKNLNLERVYTIRTIDKTFYSNIIDFTDTALSIIVWANTGKDTTYYVKHYGNLNDTTIVRPIYAKDTLEIFFSDIKNLEKDWFKNRKWLEPFGWIAAGAVLGFGILPFAAIKSKESVKEWVEFQAILLGVSLPVIFIGTRKTKYDIEKKWDIKTE